MDRTRLGAWTTLGLAVLHALSALLSGVSVELVGLALAVNAAAAASAVWLLRRPDRNRWPLTAWTAGFFGWHATGLVTLAGLVTTELDAVFAVASDARLSMLYQAVLTTAAAFAVHFLLPRPAGRP